MDDLIPEDAETGVLVVAHPDDEALWCGGLLASSPLLWTVICCSIPHRDPERAYLFFKSCEMLGVNGRLLPFSERAGPLRVDLPDLDEFDVIVTHGAAGEYGHPQHRELHDAIAGKWPDKTQRYIGYGPDGKRGRFDLPLNAVHRHTKFQALKCYGHVSPSDKEPKWKALLDYYGSRFDLWNETYD